MPRSAHRLLPLTLALLLVVTVSPRLTPPDPAAARPLGVTFSSTDVPKPIPDGAAAELAGAPVSSTTTVSGLPAGEVVADVNVTLNITHTFVGDLVLVLAGPGGSPTVTLVNRISNGGGGNSGNDFTNTVLDDSAVALIQAQLSPAAPFTGTFKPASPLSAFNGVAPNGTWTLTAQDFFIGDNGIITGWSLDITTAAAPTATATNTATATATATATSTSTNTPTATATSTATSTPTATGTGTATATGTPPATNTPTSIPTPTGTAQPTATGTPPPPTATGTATPAPATATGTPTATGGSGPPGGTATATRTPTPLAPTPTPVIPEAPPLWLFGTGLLALGWLGARRRR